MHVLLDMSDWTLDKVFFFRTGLEGILPHYRCTETALLEIGYNMRDAWSCRRLACATRTPPLSSQYALGLHYGGAALSSPVVATPLIPSICSCLGSMLSIHRGAVIVPSSGTCRPRRLYHHALLTTRSGSRSCRAPDKHLGAFVPLYLYIFWTYFSVCLKSHEGLCIFMAISCIWAWVAYVFCY